jgi:hypothetical protein
MERNAMKSKLKLFEINNLFNQFNVRLPLDEKVNIFLGRDFAFNFFIYAFL